LENPLAGDGFRALGSPISQRGDHGAAYQQEPESEGENPGWTAGFYRAEGDAKRGAPDIDRREEKRLRRYRGERTGSALVSM
jgi:hypothetical protein